MTEIDLTPDCLSELGAEDDPELSEIWDAMATDNKNFFDLTEDELSDMLRSCGLGESGNLGDDCMMVDGQLVPSIQEPDSDDEVTVDHLIDDFFQCKLTILYWHVNLPWRL